MTDTTETESFEDFEALIEMGRTLSYAAIAAGVVDGEENPAGVVMGVLLGMSEIFAMLTDDEKDGPALLRALAMAPSLQKHKRLKALFDKMTERLIADKTPLSELRPFPDAGEVRELRFLARIIDRLLPAGHQYALLHGEVVDGDIEPDGMQVLANTETASVWFHPLMEMMADEIAAMAATAAADTGVAN